MKNAALIKKERTGEEPEEPEGQRLTLATASAIDSLDGVKTENRFYTFTSPFDFEPTRDRFSLIHNETVGDGLIALTDFMQGEIVFKFTGKILPYQTLFTLQIRPGVYIEDPYVMGKVLHSCDPNMLCDMENLVFRARKPIHAGEYLFMDYDTTEDVLFRSFHCSCGAPGCRGEVRGGNFLPADVREKIRAAGDLLNVLSVS